MYLHVKLAVNRCVVCVDKLESVTSIAIHAAVSVRRASVGEEEGHLMCGFRSQRDEIPEHVGIFQVRLRIALLGVNEARKLKKKYQM